MRQQEHKSGDSQDWRGGGPGKMPFGPPSSKSTNASIVICASLLPRHKSDVSIQSWWLPHLIDRRLNVRPVLPPILTAAVLPALAKAALYARRADPRYVRIILPVLAWLVVGVAPLVSFDAVGGQTAIEIVRYVSFRGIDRDAWYAVAPIFVATGALSSLTVLLGLVLKSVGLVFNDKTLTMWGCGVILISLFVIIVSTQPVAGVSLFGIVAIPHVGWWLLLAYVAFTLSWTRGR